MTRPVCPNCDSYTALGDIHCFKCGYINSSIKFTDGFLTRVETKQRKSIVRLRSDLELNPKKFPVKALQWLYKSNIYDELIVKYFISYCTTINKVLVPAFDNMFRLKFYQLRSLLDDEEREAKYMTYGSTSEYTILYEDFMNSTTIVCEDHLSGINLRKFSNVVCLSGTKLNKKIISHLIHKYDTIIFWLDPDLPGRQAVTTNLKSIRYHLMLYNKRSYYVYGNLKEIEFKKVDSKQITQDPKKYYPHEIKNILKENLCPIG